MSTPEKRSVVTLDVKKAIIEAAAKNNNKTDLARQFTLYIADSALTLAEIVEGIVAAEESEIEMEDSGEEAKEADITRQVAQSAMNIARRYVKKNIADPTILKCSDQLDEAFYQGRKKNEKKSQLTDFFPVVE